jgi:fructokinase
MAAARRPAPSVIVVGELLADIVTAGTQRPSGAVPAKLGMEAHPGGSPANVAVTLARLGVPAGFAGRISRHGLGPWLAAYLGDNGVDISLSTDANEQPTLAVVTLDATGSADYGFYGRETADWQWHPTELPDPVAVGAKAVHSGSLACALQPGAAVVGAWLRAVHDAGTALVSYDPNVRPGLVPAPQDVERLVSGAHLVKVSDDDLRTLYPSRDGDDVARSWAASGPELVVVTAGAGGATAIRRDGSGRSRQASETNVVDTVGAGDAFMGALLAWLGVAGRLNPGGPAGLDDAQLDALLDTANAAAALTCGRPGADPPRRKDVAAAPWPEPLSR